MKPQRPLTKVCRACDTIQPVDHYYRNKASGDGYRATCKTCEKYKRILAREISHVGPEENPRGLYDTPHGESICILCKKLIPVGDDGRLERHYRMEASGIADILPRICPNSVVSDE